MELLQKVVNSILMNAIQTRPNGQGGGDNSIGKDDPDRVRVTIRDYGCGIPPGHPHMDHRPFQTTNQRGVGIELCHTPPIVEVNAGDIRFDSQLYRGNTGDGQYPRI